MRGVGVRGGEVALISGVARDVGRATAGLLAQSAVRVVRGDIDGAPDARPPRLPSSPTISGGLAAPSPSLVLLRQGGVRHRVPGATRHSFVTNAYRRGDGWIGEA